MKSDIFRAIASNVFSGRDRVSYVEVGSYLQQHYGRGLVPQRPHQDPTPRRNAGYIGLIPFGTGRTRSVKEVIHGGPASNAGVSSSFCRSQPQVLPGDRILGVDGWPVANMTEDDFSVKAHFLI